MVGSGLEKKSGPHPSLPGKTLFMTVVFGLLGAHGALFISLLMFNIATPATRDYLMSRALYESMPKLEHGLGYLGGVIGSLARLHEALVFAPFVLILAAILLIDLARAPRAPETPAEGAQAHPKRVLVSRIAIIGLVCALPLIVLPFTEMNTRAALSMVLCLYAVLLVFALFFRMKSRELSQALERSPVRYSLVIFFSGIVFVACIFQMESLITKWLFSGTRSAGAILWARMALIVASSGLLFVLMGEGGTISALAGEERSLARAFVRGLGAGVLVAAALYSVERSLNSYFFTALFEVLGEAGEPTILGFRRMTLALVLALGLPLAVWGGALMAMLPREARGKARLVSLAVPFILLVVIWYGVSAFGHYCIDVLGMDKVSLNQAAGLVQLPEAPRPRVMLRLRDTDPDQGQQVNLREKVYGFTATSVIDLVPENIPRLNRYLGEIEGRYTYHKNLAMEARRTIAGANWLVEELRELCLQNSLEKGSILNTAILLASLTHAPRTDGNRAILERLSNESLFYVGGRSCLRMAEAWAAMGDLRMAGKFYECAKQSLGKKELQRFSLPDAAGITNGSVTGRITGELARKARVGLCYLGDDDLESVYLRGLSVWKVKDAKDLPEDGSFTFGNIPEGRYFIGLLLRSGVEGTFKLKGGGAVKIDRGSPNANLGVIELSKSHKRVIPKKRRKARLKKKRKK